jgi:tetratricopeptide (TPR) repeat protein
MDQRNESAELRRRNEIVGAIAALFVPFCVYFYFLCPTIAAGDTTELINAAATLGIPHAPGYPLFTMLGHIFTWIPFKTIAWRVNLSSAVFSALACLFVYLALVRLTGRVWSGLAGALGLAFSRFFWHYAEVAEVFALNNLFVAVITYLLVRFKDGLERVHGKRGEKGKFIAEHGPRRLFWLLCLFCGLALTNHHTIILLAPGVFCFLWLSCPTLFRQGKTLAVGFALFLLGLLPYAYCPLAAMTKPLLNWDDPVTMENFLQLVLRRDFGTFSLTAMKESGSRLVQTQSYLGGLYEQFTPLGLGLAFMGLLEYKNLKQIQIYLVISFLLSGLFFVLFANYPLHRPLLLGVLQRFYIMSAVLFSFWIGFGMARILKWLEMTQATWSRLVIPVSITGSLFAWQFATNLRETNFRDNYVAEDYVHNLLLCLPEDALFFVRGDVASMGLNYFQAVLGRRGDVVVLDQEKMTYPWYYSQVKERYPDITLRGKRYDGKNVRNLHLISDNIVKREIFFRDFKESSFKKKFQAVSAGLAEKIIPRNASYPLEEVEEDLNDLYGKFIKRGRQKDWPVTSFESVIKSLYAEPFARLAYGFERAGDFEKAARYYSYALEIDPNHAMSVKNLALLLFKEKGQPYEAVELFERYLKLNPHDEEFDQIKRVVETYQR